MAKSILSTGQVVIKARPDEDDVVVRQKGGTPTAVYILHTASAPDQFLLRTFDEAVAQALAFAKHAHVAAWFTNDENDFVRLGTFRTMATRTYTSGNRTFEITLSGTPAGSDSSWTVEHLYDKSLNEEIRVPGMDSIVASTEDAFARTCDHIDKWLRSKNLTPPCGRRVVIIIRCPVERVTVRGRECFVTLPERDGSCVTESAECSG